MTDHQGEMGDIRRELEWRLSTITHRLHAIQRDRRQVNGPLPSDWQEQAVALENDEVLTQLDGASRAEVERISRALERMDAGTYGSCERCEDEIGVRRLKALPFATLCIECASAQES